MTTGETERTAPQPVRVVILDEGEADVAAVSVRMYLATLRYDYRSALKRGQQRYARRAVEKFDSALDLYERLGGDVDQVKDIEPDSEDRR